MSIFTQIKGRAVSAVIPAWLPWLVGALLLVGAYGLGRIHEARHTAKAEIKEVIKIVKGETQVVTKIQTVYQDRIKKIYVQGAQIEVDIPKYIRPVDDTRFAVNAGFVRVLDAAYEGAVAGPAADSDREPSGLALSEIAEVEAHNATSCRVWREQSLGWRDFYAGQQKVINGAAGDWYHGHEEKATAR